MFRLRARWRYLVTNPRYYFLRTIREYPHRAKHGWAPSDTWSLDYYLAGVISESVAFLRKNNSGYPGYGDADTFEKWDEILSKIEDGFKAASSLLDDSFVSSESLEVDEAYMADLERKANLGFELFGKWYFSLWS